MFVIMPAPDQIWTFFTNHSHVLICIAEDSEARMREIALRIGITERAVQKIIEDLAQAGYLEVIRDGRRNRYRLIPGRHLRHPLEQHCEIDDVIQLVLSRRVVAEQPPGQAGGKPQVPLG